MQKTDRQDAQLILRLLLEDRFPQIWVPSWENRDLRQLLWHRHRMVQARTRIMNQLQAVALNEGLRCKKRLWRERGRQQLESFLLAPWASRRRRDVLELLDRLNPTIAELKMCIRDRYLTDHIHFIHHQRKQILLLDLSNCSAAGVRTIFQAVPEFVTVRPRASVFILADFTGASFDAEAIRVMKEAAVFDKPYVRKCAWTGTEQAVAEIVSRFSGREFPIFETRKEALTWLAKD